MDKTIIVEVITPKRHPLYKRAIRHRRKYFAHDPDNRCNIGDQVLIEESRPLSRNKRWRLREVLNVAEISAEEEAPSIDTAAV